MTSPSFHHDAWLPEIIALHSRYRGDHPALIEGGAHLGWSAFGEAVDGAAAALAARGLMSGGRVAMLGQATMAMIVWQCGVLRAGGTVVAISTTVSDEALAAMLDDARVTIVIADTEQHRRLDGIAVPPSASIERIDGRDLPAPAAAFAPPPIAGEDLFSIMYSSGTTGRPKGIMLSHHSRLHYAATMAGAVGSDAASVALLTTPLCSNMSWTSLLFTLIEGGTLVLQPKFDAAAFGATVDAHGVTHALMVPTQIQRILDAPANAAASLSTLRRLYTTGSPMNATVKERAQARFTGALAEMYGMTEGFATVLQPWDMAAHPDSVGRPMRGNDIRVIDGDGQPLPRHEIGEIVAWSPMLMDGYNGDPAGTDEACWIEPDSGRRFIRSGDIGRIDGDGFVRLVGRIKDMIISGGQNIYAADLEAVLSRHPAVREAAVIGVPHTEWGETPLALVVAEADAPDPVVLRDWANARLGRHQRLVAVELRDRLPRNDGGKIVKAALRSRYWAD